MEDGIVLSPETDIIQQELLSLLALSVQAPGDFHEPEIVRIRSFVSACY